MNTKLLLISFSLATLVSASSAQVFVNGDFGTGDLTGWTVTPTSNGLSPTQTVEAFDIDFGGGLGTSNAGKFEVGQVSFQAGIPAGIELTQNLNLTAGIQYTFSFNWAATAAGDNAEGGIFDLIVNGNSLANQAAGDTGPSNPGQFGFISAAFTPGSSGSYSVGARIQRPFILPGGVFQYTDNFAVEAVPEPGSMLALAAGVSALLASRRKRAQ